MAENFDVIAMLKANISDFKSGMKEAKGTLTSFKQYTGSTFQNIGNLTAGVGTALTVGVTAPLIAAGATAFNFAADMEDAMGATDQIFGSASSSVKDWANNLESYYGIAESEALEYSNTMGSMLKNIGGLTEQEAASTSATLMELAGDLTAMYGGTVESAVQALTGALKGNNAMLDNYGMGVNDAVIKAKALEMGLSDGTSELTLQAKQAATLALITEQTADAQGQAAREADGASGSMRALMIEIKNLATELGAVLLPIITPFISKLKDMVARFREMTPEQQENIVKWGMIAAAAGPVLIVFGKIVAFIPQLVQGFVLMKAGLSKLSLVLGVIKAGGAKLIQILGVLKNGLVSVAKFGIAKLIQGIGLLKSGLLSLGKLIIAKLAPVFAFLISPIGLVVVAITAIVGVIVYLWKTNEGFRNAVISAWEAVKAMASNLWSAITTAFGNIVTSVTTAGANIVTSVKTAWDNVVTSITGAVSKAKTAAGNVMQGIVDTIKGWFSNFSSAGANIVGMIADGIKGAVGKVTGAISSVVSKIREYLPFSPAKTGPLKDIHRLNFGGTIADSIYRDAHKPITAMQDLTKGIRDTWSNDVGRLQANVGGSIKRDIQTSVNIQSNGVNSILSQILNNQQYLVLDTGAFVGHTQSAYDKANGTAINLGKRVKR